MSNVFFNGDVHVQNTTELPNISIFQTKIIISGRRLNDIQPKIKEKINDTFTIVVSFMNGIDQKNEKN